MAAETATLGYFPYIPNVQSQQPSRPSAIWGVTVTAGEYTTIYRNIEFGRHFSKLRTIRTDPALWPDGAEPPKQEAFFWASEVLRQFEDDMLNPSRVVATAAGGIAIYFARGDLYADIECFNDGTILGVLSDRIKRPTVWEIEPSSGEITRASARIRRFLASSSSDENDPG